VERPRPNLSFWFEFGSTYSYLAALTLEEAASAAGVQIEWRPFLLGPIFRAQGWDTSPFNLYPAKGRAMWRDMERQCKALGLPLVRPEPFPQNSLLAARVAVVGRQEGWVAAFSKAMFRTEFGTGLRLDDPATVALVLSQCGLDASRVLSLAATEAVKQALRAATDEALSLGVFGAPTYIAADGELFWGHDRQMQALGWARSGAAAD
jgi:2-hydroxychromene-2-carboxylate isomerase